MSQRELFKTGAFWCLLLLFVVLMITLWLTIPLDWLLFIEDMFSDSVDNNLIAYSNMTPHLYNVVAS